MLLDERTQKYCSRKCLLPVNDCHQRVLGCGGTLHCATGVLIIAVLWEGGMARPHSTGPSLPGSGLRCPLHRCSCSSHQVTPRGNSGPQCLSPSPCPQLPAPNRWPPPVSCGAAANVPAACTSDQVLAHFSLNKW